MRQDVGRALGPFQRRSINADSASAVAVSALVIFDDFLNTFPSDSVAREESMKSGGEKNEEAALLVK
jgi:hypothetical protein